MKLFLIGDIHGFFSYLEPMVNTIHAFAPDAMIVQVGDFGLYPKLKNTWHELKMPVYFIDGNHEDHRELKGITEVTEVWPGAHYIPRGTKLKIGDKQVLFIGGANSVDYRFRTLGEDYFLEEVLSDDQTKSILEKAAGTDLIVTHTPPISCIDANFDKAGLSHFGLPHSWLDISSWNVDQIWNKLGRPPLYCGHMHRAVQWNTVRILDINEVLELDL